jgi:hypothetical protein
MDDSCRRSRIEAKRSGSACHVTKRRNVPSRLSGPATASGGSYRGKSGRDKRAVRRFAKHRNLSQAGIAVTGRTRRINRNYRNSRQILKAAYKVLYDNLDEELFEASDLEILDPKFANRSSPEPYVLRAENFEKEFGYARHLIGDHLESRPDGAHAFSENITCKKSEYSPVGSTIALPPDQHSDHN